MRNQATYFELNYGVFICEPCATIHLQNFKVVKPYLKEIYTEHWDPLQRKILMHASNQVWFELCREYLIEMQHIKHKYSSKIAKWHKKKLAHLARGYRFEEHKPANANRNIDKIEDDLSHAGKKVGKFFKDIFK